MPSKKSETGEDDVTVHEDPSNIKWSTAANAYLAIKLAEKYRPQMFSKGEWDEIASMMGGRFVGRGAQISQHYRKKVLFLTLGKDGDGNDVLRLPTKTSMKRRVDAEEDEENGDQDESNKKPRTNPSAEENIENEDDGGTANGG